MCRAKYFVNMAAYIAGKSWLVTCFLKGSRKGNEGPHTLNDAGIFQMPRRVADASVG